MKKSPIIQGRVIAVVLALGVMTGVPRFSLAQLAESTIADPSPDGKAKEY